MRLLLFISLITTGCGKLFADISGSVDGNKLSGTSAYWGGPYIVITDADLDCMDMAWVKESYNENGDETETGETFNALQFTYESAEVQSGKMSIAKFSTPATAWFLIVEGGATDVRQATSGFIDLEIDKKDRVGGTFEVGFGDDGSLNGEFLIETCNNLKPRRY